MPRRAPLWGLILGCTCCCLSTGCGWWDDQAADELDETQFAEGEAAPEVAAASTPQPSIAPPAREKAPANRAAKSENKRHWPIRKTIVQQLQQRRATESVHCRSTLELTMDLASDEPRAATPGEPPVDRRDYDVRFVRVRFAEVVPGEAPVSYDSDQPPQVTPLSAQPYHGMAGHGFRFRLNGEYQLVEVAGYNVFVNRCLQDIAPEQRAAIHAALPASSPVEGVAWFVDESIGLLSPRASRAGDAWMQSQTVMHPVPLLCVTRCTLRQSTSEFAEIDLSGTITPAPAVEAAAHGAVQVTLRGGQLLGQCRIDRRSGLPIRSHIEQSLELAVRLADGSQFEQSKTIVTTLDGGPAARVDESIALTAGESSGNAPPRGTGAVPAAPQ